MRRSSGGKIFHRMHVRDGGKVLVGICPAVLRRVALPADGAPDKQLANPITIPMVGECERVRKNADLHAMYQKRFRISRSGHETDIPKVECINRSLKGLDGLYGPAGVFSDQRAACGIVPPLLKVRDGGCCQSVGILRCNQTCCDAAPGVLVLDYHRAGFAGVFRAPQNAELREL